LKKAKTKKTEKKVSITKTKSPKIGAIESQDEDIKSGTNEGDNDFISSNLSSPGRTGTAAQNAAKTAKSGATKT
jgi:hypothetical protein